MGNTARAVSAAQTSGLTPFLTAAQTGNAEMMRALIALGADPADLTPDGAGAVLMAARSRELEAVQLAVELGLGHAHHRADAQTHGRAPSE